MPEILKPGGGMVMSCCLLFLRMMMLSPSCCHWHLGRSPWFWLCHAGAGWPPTSQYSTYQAAQRMLRWPAASYGCEPSLDMGCARSKRRASDKPDPRPLAAGWPLADKNRDAAKTSNWPPHC
ncbi:hypothetical protein B0T22DRAFT_173642 [Podospora appendiculata]|uniref:Secreted protein n=1 Tax=Podospora appendiculata TaxID=314037 RepID=A0AAE0XC09_9PEZI|nr:hypothetical protein B0T22DRAFT_173642 [Podospora appendiculata]